MYVDLNERFVSNAGEAVDFTRLHDEDVAGAGFELLSVDVPPSTTRAHELNLVVGMPMRTGTAAGHSAEKIDRDAHVTVVGSDELMRAALEWQVLLSNVMHRLPPLLTPNNDGH
jgi:hypothetical protein